MTHLLITVRFLDDRFHGLLAASGPPEWPPSPFRLFCALVAGVARRGELEGHVGKALAWLQALPPPIIISPKAKKGQAITRYVPNNDGDKWPDRQDRLGTKPTIPTLLLLPSSHNPEVHYLWDIRDVSDVPFEPVRIAARSLTALGWGIDLAFADARLVNEEDARHLSGLRWRPTEAEANEAGITLRVPAADADLRESTLCDLKHCHESAMARIESGQPLHTVDEPRVFDRVFYESSADPAPRPFAAFSILKPDASGNRAFDTARRCRDVAAWIRHAVGSVCEGWPFGSIEGFVHGHNGPDKQLKGDGANNRFTYLPLPTINHALNRVESIRRVLVAAPSGFQSRIDWIRRRLPGQELVALDGEVKGLLNILPTNDWVLKRYTKLARVWSTVTPVVWPGHDDRDARKAEAILRKAFVQAGLAPELVAAIEELDWRTVGFRAGVDLAHRFQRPDHMNGRTYHVRVRFPHPIPGPLAVGAGRYRGFGLFAAED